jgi:diaminopimelate epimerase
MAKIFKLSGTGNHFLLIDLRKSSSSHKNRSQIAKVLCDPYNSIGADGLVFIEKSHCASLRWDFYNADGSNAEMCGNAARCVGRYIMLHPGNLHGSVFTIETRAGVIKVITPKISRQKPGQSVPVMVEMPRISEYLPGSKLKFRNRLLTFDTINSGVPHAVIRSQLHLGSMDDTTKIVDNLGEIVNKVRALTQFKRSGINVTFYWHKKQNSIDSLTFERGVQGYTRACGTGAIAAATSYLSGHPGKVRVRVPGGVLHVNLRGGLPKLSGPARYIAEIEVF